MERRKDGKKREGKDIKEKSKGPKEREREKEERKIEDWS